MKSNNQIINKEYEYEYEYDYEEDNDESIKREENKQKVSLAEILNESDKSFDKLFRSLSIIQQNINKKGNSLSPSEIITKLSEELSKSEEKDRLLLELDSRISFLSKNIKNIEKSDEELTFKKEELAAMNARFDSASSDLSFEEEIFKKLSNKVNQHDNELKKQIDLLREQNKNEFEASNKQIKDEIDALKAKTEQIEKEKIQLQQKAIESAKESALIKAGGSKEVEKLKVEITEKLKSIVQNMVSDVFDAVSSNFDDETVYNGPVVVKAIKIALQNAADELIPTEEEDDEYE